MSVGYLYVFFEKMFIQVLYPFLISFFFFLFDVELKNKDNLQSVSNIFVMFKMISSDRERCGVSIFVGLAKGDLSAEMTYK